MEKSDKIIKQAKIIDVFEKASASFLKEQKDLITSNVSERCWYTPFAIYLNEEIKKNNINGYYVDTEYNRNGGKLKTIFDNEVPVVASGTQIIRPYKATDVEIAKNYYDYKADADTQKKALLYYEDTYLQNSGVEYKGSDNFDVVSILNGTVISIKNDNILGNVVEVRHDNDMISVYQSLSDVKVN